MIRIVTKDNAESHLNNLHQMHRIRKTVFEDRLGCVVLINDQDQHLLWPAAAEIPAGWSIAFEQNGRQACIEYINRNWTDMRPRTGADIQRA